jgi:hypothetical protein
MGERESEKKKPLKDRAQELIKGVVDALESLFPGPQLQPIPVRARPRPRPMRR